MLKTLNTLINMKEVTNYLKWGVNQGVIAMHGPLSWGGGGGGGGGIEQSSVS